MISLGNNEERRTTLPDITSGSKLHQSKVKNVWLEKVSVNKTVCLCPVCVIQPRVIQGYLTASDI